MRYINTITITCSIVGLKSSMPFVYMMFSQNYIYLSGKGDVSLGEYISNSENHTSQFLNKFDKILLWNKDKINSTLICYFLFLKIQKVSFYCCFRKMLR